MTDKSSDHHRRDDIDAISQQYQSMTTDSNLNINEQSMHEPTMSKFKNSASLNSIHGKKTTSCASENNWTSNDLPGMNLPERILFVIDTAKEIDCTPFEARAGDKFSPLYMIKRVVNIFVNAKSGIDKKHKYAFMALKNDEISWVSDFAVNSKALLANLEKIEEDPIEAENLYDLGPCFEAICDNTNMAENISPPDSVSRVILIYTRSRAIPVFTTKRSYFDRLTKNAHFYLDCLYVHEPLNDDNDCQVIYTKLGELDIHQSSYIFEVGRNLAALHTNMAKLIAHPLQRARQDNSPYAFYNPTSQEDSQTNV